MTAGFRMGFRVLGPVILVASAIVAALTLTGHGYVLTAMDDTYLRGRLSPPITENGSSLTHHVRVIAAGTPQPWATSARLSGAELAPDTQRAMQSYGTAAFLVVRDGVIETEKYWPGFSVDSRTNSNSVAKSFIGALTGIALASGALRSLDAPVADFVPEFANGRRAQVTVRHLLTMSATTDFHENYNNALDFPARMHYGTDLTQTLIDLFDIIDMPGKRFKYDSSNTAVLGLVLQRATGRRLSEYLSEKLWKPLGAEHAALWSLDHENGVERAYCCMYATARDYARLGQLYLQGGVWNGLRLIPEDYVEQSVRAADLVDATGQPTSRYGYSWWRTEHRGHPVFYAWGYQGQYVAVIPDQKLVMVRLGDGGGLTEAHDRMDLPLYLDAALASH